MNHKDSISDQIRNANREYSKLYNNSIYVRAAKDLNLDEITDLQGDALVLCGHPSFRLSHRFPAWGAGQKDFLDLFSTKPAELKLYAIKDRLELKHTVYCIECDGQMEMIGAKAYVVPDDDKQNFIEIALVCSECWYRQNARIIFEAKAR